MAIIKILKNQTSPAVDVELKKPGITIPASGIYTIEPLEYNLWTAVDVINEITPFINSGDIIVNDGIRDLIAAEAIRYLEKMETVDVQKNGVDVVKAPTILNFEDNLTIINDGNGKVTIKASSIGETIEERLIHTKCVPGQTGCILEASILIDQTQNFIKKGSC